MRPLRGRIRLLGAAAPKPPQLALRARGAPIPLAGPLQGAFGPLCVSCAGLKMYNTARASRSQSRGTYSKSTTFISNIPFAHGAIAVLNKNPQKKVPDGIRTYNRDLHD